MNQNLLTVGMACYRNFDETWFTVQILRHMHGWRFDVVVVDNAPERCRRTEAATLSAGGRYYHRPDLNGTSRPRDAVFQFSRTEWTMCVDSHVILGANTITRLTADLAARPGSPDILTGPMVNDDWRGLSTHWRPAAPPGLWGEWDGKPDARWALAKAQTDNPIDRDAGIRALDAHPPFEIPSQGLGLFLMRTAAWPGFNRRFRGFGGEEGYIHEKVRRRGGKA